MQHRSAVEAEKGSFGIDRLQQSLMLQAESEQARQREAVANSSIQALRAPSEAAEATAAKLKRRVSELEAQIAGIQTRVQDADFAFLEKLNGKLAEIKRLEAKSEVAVKELKQREGDLRKLADQFRVLKETCARLQQELDARDLTLQSVTASGQAMRQLDALARRLLEAQDNIRTRYADEGVAHRTSLLLNHSLAHLALATAAGDDARRAAMLANLFRIGTGLQAVEQFPAVLNSLRSMEPEIETLGERLQVNGASRPGRALFERVVNLSRAQSGLALGPFHYDVDQHGMVYSTG
jgi:chromosome segregation ATPase